MDYAALPPEINSGRLYAGPGSAPMMAAASAWRTLASELTAALSSYGTVVSQLASEEWMGPASAAMASAATPQLSWMSETVATAEQAAGHATAAAAAFETAHATTPAPAVIAANRAQNALLVSTNFLGQNTAAIMANEAHYLEMWAQAAAVMYGYAASSASAAQINPFSQPTQTTNPAGQSAQAAATAQATGTPAANAGGQIAQLMPTLQSSIQGLASPAAAAAQPAASGDLVGFLESILGNDSLNGFAYLIGNPMYNFANTMGTGAAFIPSSLLPSMIGYMTGGGFNALGGGAAGSGLGALLPGGALGALGGLGATSAVTSGFTASATTPITAAMGKASLVGSFSVPDSWTTAAPGGATPAAAQGAGWAVAPERNSMAAMPGGLPPGTIGRGLNYGTPRYGFRPTIMRRPKVC